MSRPERPERGVGGPVRGPPRRSPDRRPAPKVADVRLTLTWASSYLWIGPHACEDANISGRVRRTPRGSARRRSRDPRTGAPGASRSSAERPAASTRATVCSDVSPAPVDQWPSTRTRRPPGCRRATHRASAAAGSGIAHRTWRDSTTSYGAGRERRTRGVALHEGDIGAGRVSGRLGPRPPHHRGGDVDARDGVPLLGEQQAERAGAGAEVSHRRRGGRKDVEQQLAPGRAHPGVAQPMVGRLVERGGFVVPDFDRVACGHGNTQPPATDTPVERRRAVTSGGPSSTVEG